MTVSSRPPAECEQLLQNLPVELEYLAEGAANVIYNISPLSTEITGHEQCYVLRMRKDLPTTKPCRESMEEFERFIIPLFNEFDLNLLMKQILYKLTPEMVSTANANLKLMEDNADLTTSNRPMHRRSVFHPSFEQEMYGILMPNLDRQEGHKFVEFKPKWLVQSPSAPKDALLCRTCALNSLRRHQGKDQGRGDSGFCPFDLLSTIDDVLIAALRQIWHQEETLPEIVQSFRNNVQPALRHLQKLQMQYGNVGSNDFQTPGDKDLPIAMALRDCSIFLEVATRSTASASQIVNVKFADLDLKSAEDEKLRRWADIEKSLIDEGAYFGRVGHVDNCAFGRNFD